MFAKHLPPSAGVPRVLQVGTAAPLDLPPEVARQMRATPAFDAEFDAVVGDAPDSALPDLGAALRPGGRVILAQPLATDPTAQSAALLATLTAAGLVHCLVEPQPNGWVLYRGERPPVGSSFTRTQTLAQTTNPPAAPFVFLLVTQTPNKPAWRLTPEDRVAWQAVTALETNTGQRMLLGFSSLVKAVAFMQAAILAKAVSGINKVGKFPAAQAATWSLPVWHNPDFALFSGVTFGPPLAVDPQTAITGDE